jgi:putative ABC transport system permease protein
MRLALKELLHSRKKYLLVEIIVVLMMFMVLLLSGLVQGLGRAVSSGVETMDADTFVMSDDSEKLLTVSSLTDDEYSQVKSEYGNRATTIDIQRMYLEKDGSTEKVDVTYFAIDPEKFLNPDVYEGERLSTGENEVVLDDSFESDGISVGDTVKDASSGIELKVVGFTKDKMYGHVAVAYVSTDTYRAMMLEVNPMYKDTVHAVAVQGAAGAQIDGTAAYTKAEVVQAIPGYQAEQMTITMVEWLLVVITAVIIGIFFFVINLQKEKEFGVMKAIGTSTARLTRFIICQVFLIAASGAVVACALVALMSSFLPASMPFYLVWGDVATVLVAFVLISILSSLASIARVVRIDPAKIIGGDFQ